MPFTVSLNLFAITDNHNNYDYMRTRLQFHQMIYKSLFNKEKYKRLSFSELRNFDITLTPTLTVRNPVLFLDISKVITAVDVQGNAQELIESQQIKIFYNFV